MTPVAHQPTKGYRLFTLSEHEYELFVSDKTFARERLDQLYGQNPEMFPASFEKV